jgi:chemotaxis protein histidine kinase CheA
VIRYGRPRNEALQSPKSALPVLLIPSPVLQNLNMEILISSVNAPASTVKSTGNVPSDALVSPFITIPAATDGRQSVISQPVHRTLLVMSGLDQLLSVAELLARTRFASETEKKLVDVVVDTTGEMKTSDLKTIAVSTVKAEEGLRIVREAFANATQYEKAWTESGMPALSRWLASSSAKTSTGLSSTLRDVIASALEATSNNIATEAQEAEATARSKALSDASRKSLEIAIATFARQGHAELQSGLAAAWSSRNWRKLAFWKLFWRVDDVPLVVTDLVTTAWLPRTERAVYELSGRLKQAGIPTAIYPEPTAISEPQISAVPVVENVKEMAANPAATPLILASTATTESVSTPVLPPHRTLTHAGPLPYTTPSLASAISSSRQKFITTAITSLTSSAQQIVLKAATITGVSASLSALSFLSITSGSIYESATIVALGTAYALRRMQKEWEVQCKDLENGLMEEGRSVLKQTEEKMRRLVRDASQVVEDEVEMRIRKEATDAVEKAKTALSELK